MRARRQTRGNSQSAAVSSCRVKRWLAPVFGQPNHRVATTFRLPCVISVALGWPRRRLLVAVEPLYDAWAWLVWGRELAHLGLDTSSGPPGSRCRC